MTRRQRCGQTTSLPWGAIAWKAAIRRPWPPVFGAALSHETDPWRPSSARLTDIMWKVLPVHSAQITGTMDALDDHRLHGLPEGVR